MFLCKSSHCVRPGTWRSSMTIHAFRLYRLFVFIVMPHHPSLLLSSCASHYYLVICPAQELLPVLTEAFPKPQTQTQLYAFSICHSLLRNIVSLIEDVVPACGTLSCTLITTLFCEFFLFKKQNNTIPFLKRPRRTSNRW